MQLIALCIRMFLQSNGMLDERVWYTEKIEGGVSFRLGVWKPKCVRNGFTFFVCCYLYIIMYEKKSGLLFCCFIDIFIFIRIYSKSYFFLSFTIVDVCMFYS